MDVSVRLEAVEAAQNLLYRFKAERADWQDDQTPVEQIAAWLGCEIATFHPDDYPEGTYGFLEPGEQLIWLCRNLSVTLRRFTLAHELGHVVLHSHIPVGHDLPTSSFSRLTPANMPDVSAEDPCQAHDIQEELTGLLEQQVEELGNAAYDPRSQRELAANLFAAELLMPLERVWDLYVRQHVAPDELALLFHVSQAAMLNRLTGLLSEPSRPTSIAVAQKNLSLIRPAAPTPASARRSYDQFQQAAIEAPTPALVVAGPGSGKTSTLIGRADFLLRQQNVRAEHILALTFSRKAAQEMQERLQSILPPGQLPPTISTFHAFCAELLRTCGQRVGLRKDFELVDDAGGYFLLRGLAGDLPLRHYQNLHNPTAPFLAFLKAISRAKDELVTPERYRELAYEMLAQATDDAAELAAEQALEVAAVYSFYQKALEQRGDTDFGGLLMLTVELLTRHSDLRSEIELRYQHILVDEFQDINRASGVLLRLLAGEQKRVWVVGDANQSIYGFRGASPANISQFHLDYPGAAVLPLNCNYRSRPDIVQLADTFRRGILEQNSELEAVQTARATENEPYVTLAVATDEASEVRALVRDLQQKLDTGYRSRDIVVLCRTRALVRKITRGLAEAGLPVDERAGFLEQEHVKNLLSLLLLLGDESGMGILRAARLPDHLLSQEDIEVLLRLCLAQQTTPLMLILREEDAGLSSSGSQALARLAIILKNLYRVENSVWQVLARYLLSETSLGRDLLEAGNSTLARMIREDYSRLLQYAHAYDQHWQTARRQAEARARELGEELSELPGIKAQIQGFLEYFQILLNLRQEGEGKRTESDEEEQETPDLVRVMTVHASKGLEFPVVYLPGLAQRRFPLQKRPNPVPPPTGMLPAESEGERAHEGGEACLFYVGVTRARDQLILSYSERYGKQSAKRSDFIDALVVGLPDERVRRVLWPREESKAAVVNGPAVEVESSIQPSDAFIEVMESGKLRAGQLEEYQICPRRYAYSSIYHFQRDEGAFLPFWQATSETVKTLVERFNASELEQRITSKEQIAELFQRNWQAQGGDALPFAHLYVQHGQEIADQFWGKLMKERTGNWKLRHNLNVELAGRTIEVSIDRLETATESEQPTKFVRTRFGKSKGKPTPGTRELLYLHARRQHHPGQEVALETHNLSTGETHTIKVTERKEESLLGDLERTIAGIERRDYTPKPDSFICPTCPFYLICPV